MKNNFNKIFFSIAFVLFGALLSVAQVVTVPSTCNVVVAGTGGTLGFGGVVGSGGIVTMPDTFAGGAFTCTIPSGYTLTGWSLKGDLSVVFSPLPAPTVVPPATTASLPPALQPVGVLSSYNIMSYNKSYRQTEGTTSFGKSKGTVRIGYNNGACSGYSMSFEVYKTFTTTPSIVGPACVEANKPCTFSIDQVVSDNANDAIGFDQYYWSGIPTAIALNSLYYSADNSSVTFTPTTSGVINLKCCIGRANPWDAGTNVNGLLGTTCVTKTVGAAPAEPSYTTSPNNLCVPTGTATSFTINYTSANTCTWTAPNTGWSVGTPIIVTLGTNDYSVTINTNGFNNPGVLILTVSNSPCTALTFQYQINRSLAAPVAIAPVVAGANCLNMNSSNNMFSISTSASANLTTWSVAPAGTGVTLATQTPNSTVAVNVASSATIGTYTLTAKSTSCTGNITYPFTVRPNVPTMFTGVTCVVKGAMTPQTYYCGASNGATYTWSFPAGWSAPSFTTTTNQITVTPSSTTAVLNGTATVVANGITGCNNSAIFTIGYASTAPTGVTPNCFSVGVAGAASVTFTNPLPGTYTATMISTVAGSTNVITSPVTLSGNVLSFSTSALAAGTYNLAITHNSGCNATTATSTTLVTVAGNGAQMFTLTSSASDTYFVSGAPAGASFVWYVNGVLVATPTSSPNQLPFGGTGAAPTSVYCLVSYNGCTTKVAATSFGTHSQKMAANATTIDGTTIYPNPNSGAFTINVVEVKETATATLYDMSGRELDTFVLKTGENSVQKEGLSRGTYIVSLTVDGKTTAQKIRIK